MELSIANLEDSFLEITWNQVADADTYKIYWADMDTDTVEYREISAQPECSYTLKKATHVPHYLKVKAFKGDTELACSEALKTPIKKVFNRQLEKINRGLQAVPVKNGIFLSWRLFVQEVDGYSKTGLTGANFKVYRNNEEIALVTDSTNYLDTEGTKTDKYQVAPVVNGVEEARCEAVTPWDREYLDIPVKKPAGGVTPAGEAYEYHANDMSIGDVDGDGEYEYFVKWDPSNSHDVSHKGYTGNCYLDCYKLDGQLLWRLDMGVNIRSGAHYTQFMVYDFNGDGKAEMA